MSVKVVEIPEIGSVHFYKRAGSRAIRLSITGAGKIRVTLPKWVPYHAAEAFVRSRTTWIKAQSSQSAQTILEHGQQIGKAHRLVLVGADTTRVSSRVLPTEIRVTHPRAMPLHHTELQKTAHKAGIRALRQEAEQLLPKRLKQLADFYDFSYNSVAVKSLKSRCGSCSSQQDIILNIYLMQLPWHLVDYVLMHELTHTKVMQHGAPFWQEMERHLPNAKALRNEINAHQPILTPIAPAVA